MSMTEWFVAAAVGSLAGVAAGELSRRLAVGRRPTGLPDRLSWLLGAGGAIALIAHASWPGDPGLATEAAQVGLLLLVLACDVRERAVYPAVVYPGVAFAVWAAPLGGGSVIDATLGAATSTGVFAVLYVIGRLRYGPGALGAGDGSVAALLGAIAGLSRLAPALMLASLIGAGLAMLVGVRARSLRTTMPYAPALCLAAFGVTFLPPS